MNNNRSSVVFLYMHNEEIHKKNIFLIKNTFVYKDFMKTTYDYSNPVLSLLSST